MQSSLQALFQFPLQGSPLRTFLLRLFSAGLPPDLLFIFLCRNLHLGLSSAGLPLGLFLASSAAVSSQGSLFFKLLWMVLSWSLSQRKLPLGLSIASYARTIPVFLDHSSSMQPFHDPSSSFLFLHLPASL